MVSKLEEKQYSNSSCQESSCEGCKNASGCSGRNQADKIKNINNKIGKVIAVMSGKGGVGKSLVTSSIAVRLIKKGYKVGILDSDVTGPSIPKMFGMDGLATSDGDGINPGLSKSGIKVMSVNLLLPDKEEPVIWRGPVIASVVKQFYSEVYWGELDYLLIDMPPGTGDVPLTVFQSIPVDGAIIVTSPQDLVKMIVKKAYNMAKKMNIPIIGMIENYSYLECPDCGRKIEIFGKSNVDNVAAEIGIPVMGKLPIMPECAKLADEGCFDDTDAKYMESAVEYIVTKY